MGEEKAREILSGLGERVGVRQKQLEALLAEDKPGLARLLEKEAELTANQEEREWLFLKAGEFWLETGEREEAKRLFSRIEPDSKWRYLSLSLLRIQAFTERDFSALAQIYQELAEVSSFEEARAYKLLRARLLAFSLGEPAKSEELLAEILKESPDYLPGLLTRAQIYLEAGNWKGLAEAYQALFQLAEAKNQLEMSQAYAFRCANLMESRIGSPLSALDWYLKISDSPRSIYSLPAVIEILESLRQEKELKQALERFLEELDPGEKWFRALLLFKLSRFYQQSQEPEKELELILQVVELDPENLFAWWRLESLARESQNLKLLARSLEAISQLIPDPELKFAYLVELAEIYLNFLEDFSSCQVALERAEELKPEHLSLLRIRQSLAFRQRNWQELIKGLEQELLLTQDPKELQALLILKAEAELYGENDLEASSKDYLQALEVAPSQFPVLRSLEQILLARGDYEAYLKINLAIENLVTPKENRVYYAWRRAIISELGLARTELAVSAWRDLIEQEPEFLFPYLCLWRTLREKRARENYLKAQERVLSLAGSSLIYPFLLFLGAWELEKLFQETESSESLWGELLSAESRDLILQDARRWLFYRAKRWQELKAVWAEFMERVSSPVLSSVLLARQGFYSESFLGAPRDARLEYERALEQTSSELIYLALLEISFFQSDWESALALIRELARNFASELKAGYFWQAGRIGWEKGLEQKEAINSELAEAHQLNPDPVYLFSLLEYYGWGGDKDKLAELLEVSLSLVSEGQALVRELEYVRFLFRELGEKERALEEYLRLSSAYSDSIAVVRELELIGLELSHWKVLADALSKEISLQTDPELLTFLHHQLAEVYEKKLGEPERTISTLRALMNLRPDWLYGLEELHRLYQAQGSWEELVSVINREIGLIKERERRIQLYLESARIYQEKLNQSELAIESLLGAHSLEPENLEILNALERLYQKLERWQELVGVVEKKISLVSDASEKARLFAYAGEIYEQKLRQIEKAVSAYEEAEKLVEMDEQVLRALERLYPELEAYQKLIPVLEKLVKISGDKTEQVSLLNRVGKIYQEKLGETERAIEAHLRALELEPANEPALRALISLYQAKGEPEEQVKYLVQLAGAKTGTSPQESYELYLQAGEIYEKELGDDDSALRLYEQAHQLYPSDLRALDLAEGIYQRHQDWAGLIKILERKAELSESPQEQKELYTRIGALYQEKLGDESRAENYYARAVVIDSEYLPALKPLAEIYYAHQRWEEAEKLYQIWSKYLDQEETLRRAEILYHFGQVEEKLDKIDRALEYYQASCQLKPHYLEPLERLFELYLEREDRVSAESFGRELVLALEEVGDKKRLFDRLHKMGELEAELGKTEPAVDYLERALNLRPDHYPSLRLLVNLYQKQENWTKALSSYDRLVRSTKDPAVIAQGLVEKGEILEQKLNQLESAIAHYQKAVEVKQDYLLGWRRLGEALVQAQKWREAESAYQRIVELEPSAEKKVEDYYQLGLIYRDGFGDLERARQAFETVLNLNKTHLPSIEAILSLYLKQKQWEKYLEVSERFIRLLPREEIKKSIPIHYQRAQVYRDFLEDREKAIIEFQTILRLDPDHLQSRIELAELYAKDSKYYLQAIKEHQAILERDLFRLESYHQMGQLYELQGRLDEAYCCYAVLEMFGSLSQDEQMFLDAHQRQVPHSSKKSLTTELHFRALAHPWAKGTLLELLADLGDYLVDLFPVSLEKFGAHKSRKVPANSTAGIKKLTDEIAHNLGVEAYDLYLVATINEPRLVATNPPSLIINSDWLNRFPSLEQRFIIGRWMEMLKLRLGLLQNHPPQEVLRAILLFVWLFAPEVKVPGLAEGEIEKRAKAVKRAVPRKVRSQLEEKAKLLAKEGLPKDLNLWQKGLSFTANRSGMLVTGDLKASLSALFKLIPRFRDLNFAELGDPKSVIEQEESARDLLRFWTTDLFFSLRKRSGYSLLSS